MNFAPRRTSAGLLVRCGAAAPPNYDEGCAAESRAGFIHKLGIALKLKETTGSFHYHLRPHPRAQNNCLELRIARAVEHPGPVDPNSEIQAPRTEPPNHRALGPS